MKLTIADCPVCNESARHTVEQLSGTAELELLQDGTFEHTGSTDVSYDSSATVKDKTGRVQVGCSNGHEWFTESTE